jgi:hypothetical protein
MQRIIMVPVWWRIIGAVVYSFLAGFNLAMMPQSKHPMAQKIQVCVLVPAAIYQLIKAVWPTKRRTH